MEFICSDTNVWIDFAVIDRIELPFKLPYKYIMFTEAIDDEILSPAGLGGKLLKHGLVGIEITIDEFELAEKFCVFYPRLSKYDRIALAIAKIRRIVLLTGDGTLRKAAKSENVSILGTLAVLDRLYEGKYITVDEYEFCIMELKRNNGAQVRLPKEEINSRLQRAGHLKD